MLFWYLVMTKRDEPTSTLANYIRSMMRTIHILQKRKHEGEDTEAGEDDIAAKKALFGESIPTGRHQGKCAITEATFGEDANDDDVSDWKTVVKSLRCYYRSTRRRRLPTSLVRLATLRNRPLTMVRLLIRPTRTLWK